MILYNFFCKSTSAVAKKRGFNRNSAASWKGFVHIDYSFSSICVHQPQIGRNTTFSDNKPPLFL